MSLDLGRLADTYDVLAKLKEGGMGAVYKVLHRQLDEVRVVKVLHLRYQDDPELKARFENEARAASRLRGHPNIVRVHDFQVDGDRGLLVLEHVDGVDLTQLEHGPSLPLVLEIARQGLDALGYLHRNGFVHRDVSPDNFMLTTGVDRWPPRGGSGRKTRPHVKLVDLGIAKVPPTLKTERVKTDNFLGKPLYASPEHFGPSEKLDGRSDIYSFGVLLYELLTGHNPIGQAGDTLGQVILAHLQKPPLPFEVTDPEGRVPEGLRQLVLQALAKRPTDRIESAAVFEHGIVGLQAQHPMTDRALAEARELTVRRQPSEPPPSTHGPAVDSDADTLTLVRPATPSSPFVVGSPIERDEDFFGREAQCRLLRAALERGQPAQILGERRMGKTSLLRWVERHAPNLQDRPVVRVDVQGLDGRSPGHLVRAVARDCGRLDDAADDLDRGRSPTEVLDGLLPLVLLVDEADALAAPGHGFNDGFLDDLRSFGQAGRLVWVSASYRELRSIFESSGLTSSFLNDSRLVWVGQFEDDAAHDLAVRAGDEAATVAARLAAGFAYGLQWVGDALWQGTETADSVGDAFADVAEPFFQRWWKARDEEERRLLTDGVTLAST